MHIVLISPYELGRQPFGLAEPAAMLGKVGCSVQCFDLSLQKLDSDRLGVADVVGVYIGMHTATRIAMEAIPRIRELAPQAHLCVYGLYAPVNEQLLRQIGAQTVLGGEFETGLMSLVQRLNAGGEGLQTEPVINLSKVDFLVPDRSGLPSLSRYAHLVMPDGTTKISGFVEASRGCKHYCRHCPVVPVYQGRFRIVSTDVVMADIRNQVAVGAEHFSFGDPDFLNGPTHALRVVRALHQEFPQVTYDATIKIEHLVRHRALLAELKATGCLFIISAVESVDDETLGYLDKGHTNADFEMAVRLLRQVGIALVPTFVAFSPWTTLQAYIDLLRRLLDLELVARVQPIQLAIRLLIPAGSYLFNLPGFQEHVGEFDPHGLGYPWKHEDPRVDQLQEAIQNWVASAEAKNLSRSDIFTRIWGLAHQALGQTPPPLNAKSIGEAVPRLSEPWYCCAEPTSQQLVSF
jgi:radical SAM superfamily enzyme YgiQ (UPF0313 family)